MRFLDKFFKLSYYKTTIRKEFMAGLTTFLAMSYVIFVNPNILAEAGMPKMALITSTILISIIGTLFAAFIPKLPMAIAPGMGLNAFFVFTLVIGQKISYQQALAIVFISGIILFVLSLLNFQKKIIQYLPDPIKIGSMVGIGLLLTLVGINSLGLIVPNSVTFVQLNKITPQTLLGLLCLLFIIIMIIKKVPGAIVLGIIFCTILSCIFGFSRMPEHFIASPPSIAPIFMQMDLKGILSLSFIMPIFTLIFVDLFDSLASISANIENLTFMTEKEKTIAMNRMLKVDSLTGSLSGVFGNSTTIVYLESLSGIMQGGKTGLTSLFIALFFVIALFLTPLIAIVPPYASASALIIIGIQMSEVMKKIDYSDLRFAAPAYVTALMMPFTYNISFGIIFGFLSYIGIELASGNYKSLHWTHWIIGVLCILNLYYQ